MGGRSQPSSTYMGARKCRELASLWGLLTALNCRHQPGGRASALCLPIPPPHPPSSQDPPTPPPTPPLRGHTPHPTPNTSPPTPTQQQEGAPCSKAAKVAEKQGKLPQRWQPCQPHMEIITAPGKLALVLSVQGESLCCQGVGDGEREGQSGGGAAAGKGTPIDAWAETPAHRVSI